jgi:hypothetical protein
MKLNEIEDAGEIVPVQINNPDSVKHTFTSVGRKFDNGTGWAVMFDGNAQWFDNNEVIKL